MSKSSLDIVDRVDRLLQGIVIIVLLVIVVKIDEIGIVVIVPLPLWAVAGEMPLLTALETCIVSCVTRQSLSIGNIPSSCASTSSASPIIWGTGSINVHWDWLVVHPLRCIGGVVLGSLLSLSSSSLAKSLVTVPSSSSVLGEEWAIRCVSSSKCRKVWRRISSASTVLRRIAASLRREDGVQ